jgi:hypothetical protein
MSDNRQVIREAIAESQQEQRPIFVRIAGDSYDALDVLRDLDHWGELRYEYANHESLGLNAWGDEWALMIRFETA